MSNDQRYGCSTARCGGVADGVTAAKCYCHLYTTAVTGSYILNLLCEGTQGSSSASYTAPRLTYPQDTQDAAGGLHAEESESDILPFAIDGDTAAFDATSPSADGKTCPPGIV